MKAWVTTDSDGRITASTTLEEYSAGMQEIEVDDGFDFILQSDYVLKDGKLKFDGKWSGQQEQEKKEAEAVRLHGRQMETAVVMYVKSADLPRVQAVSVCTLYDDWSGKGVKYTKGQWLRYGDDFAYVEQDHTSQPDWTPEAAPSLYTIFRLAPDGVRIWEQPTRAENAFDTGEECHYPDAGGEVWVSKIDGNTTVPGSDDRYWRLRDADTE